MNMLRILVYNTQIGIKSNIFHRLPSGNGIENNLHESSNTRELLSSISIIQRQNKQNSHSLTETIHKQFYPIFNQATEERTSGNILNYSAARLPANYVTVGDTL